MGYYIDLSKISIDQYKESLKTADLLPSWQILKENIDTNLDTIKKSKINNLEELQAVLKTKQKVEKFSLESGLDNQYLSVLRRVINGYCPKPNLIKDFANISDKTLSKLESLGIKNTLQLYPEILTAQSRKELAKRTETDPEEILKLARLTDLSRIRWVNHTFASMLLFAGYQCAREVAESNPKEMYQKVKEINAEINFYKGNIGEHDMKLCIEAAETLDFEIDFNG